MSSKQVFVDLICVCTIWCRNGYNKLCFNGVYIASNGQCPAISGLAIMSLWLGVELVTLPRRRSNV